VQARPDYDTPRLWAQLASCKRLTHEPDAAVHVYDQVLLVNQ
jgi:hypothetical protein